MRDVTLRLDISRILFYRSRRGFCFRRLVSHSFSGLKTNSADIVGLGNVCLDIRVPVKAFPSRDPGWRRRFIDDFFEHPVEGSVWEAGGIANTLIAAHRLGLKSVALGHLGEDIYGTFCKDCFAQEEIEFRSSFKRTRLNGIDRNEYVTDHPFLTRTAICFVVVDPSQRHCFVSHFQVNPGPVFCHRSTLSSEAIDSIRNAKGLLMNGYAFQECGKDLLEYVFEEAVQAGTVTFFDPGPYGVSLMNGSVSEKQSLLHTIRHSNVILVTAEEATKLTGVNDPKEAGYALMKLTTEITKWLVIKLGADGSLFFQRHCSEVVHTNGFQVSVSDTVGCGDSFAAAIVLGYLSTGGEDPTGVLELANAVGAITATGCGAGRNVANLDNVRLLLEKQRSSCSGHNQRDIEAALKLLERSEESALQEASST